MSDQHAVSNLVVLAETKLNIIKLTLPCLSKLYLEVCLQYCVTFDLSEFVTIVYVAL
jgi:hypothetical protein